MPISGRLFLSLSVPRKLCLCTHNSKINVLILQYGYGKRKCFFYKLTLPHEVLVMHSQYVLNILVLALPIVTGIEGDWGKLKVRERGQTCNTPGAPLCLLGHKPDSPQPVVWDQRRLLWGDHHKLDQWLLGAPWALSVTGCHFYTTELHSSCDKDNQWCIKISFT